MPRTPSERIGTAAPRKRRQPMSMPPSKRITIRATTAIRSTVTNEIASWSRGTRSEIAAAATRKSAALGIASRSVIARPKSASETPAGDDEDDQTEVCDLRHRVNLGLRHAVRGAYTFLT